MNFRDSDYRNGALTEMGLRIAVAKYYANRIKNNPKTGRIVYTVAVVRGSR